MLNCNLFLWSKLYFQHHYCSLQCHMIFRNHNNMLICCSRNISDYYQCWKQLCCTIFLWKLMHFISQDSQINRKFKRTAFIWNIEIKSQSWQKVICDYDYVIERQNYEMKLRFFNYIIFIFIILTFSHMVYYLNFDLCHEYDFLSHELKLWDTTP